MAFFSSSEEIRLTCNCTYCTVYTCIAICAQLYSRTHFRTVYICKKKQSVPLLCHAMIKFFLLLCSLEAEEVATHGAPEAWKEARERVDKTFQVFFHTFVSPAQYILYLIQLNCTKVNDDVNDEYEDIDDYDDIYIMMKCLSVCLSVTKNHHFLLGVSCNHLNHP